MKCIVTTVLVFVLLASQTFADVATAPATGQATESTQSAPKNTGALSRHNQSMIKQEEAQKVKNEKSKARLSKRNQAALKQAEAARFRRELIDMSNPDFAKQ